MLVSIQCAPIFAHIVGIFQLMLYHCHYQTVHLDKSPHTYQNFHTEEGHRLKSRAVTWHYYVHTTKHNEIIIVIIYTRQARHTYTFCNAHTCGPCSSTYLLILQLCLWHRIDLYLRNSEQQWHNYKERNIGFMLITHTYRETNLQVHCQLGLSISLQVYF